MTESFDPYAPPQADARPDHVAPSDGSVGWRLDGDRLAIRKGAALPGICLWNGEPTAGPRIRRKLTWIPTWARLLAVSPLIFVLVYFLVRKTGEFEYSLSAAARRRRRNGILLACAAIIAAIALIVAATFSDSSILVVVAVPFFIATIVAAVWGRTVRLARIDKEFIYLTLPPAAVAAFERLT